MQLKYLIHLLVCILCFSSCGSDDEVVPVNPPTDLYQTYWEGTITNGAENQTQPIKLTFSTKDAGEFHVDSSAYSYSMNYSLEGRILNIYDDYTNILDGFWWILESRENAMVLKRNFETSDHPDVLDIHRVY